MNHRQAIIGWIAAGLFALACLVPPWEYTLQIPRSGVGPIVKPAGYALVFSPPSPEELSAYYGVHIDLSRLIAELATVVVVGGVGILATRGGAQRRPPGGGTGRLGGGRAERDSSREPERSSESVHDSQSHAPSRGQQRHVSATCTRCGTNAPTELCSFSQNVSAMFTRRHAVYTGYFCRRCASGIFLKCTITTLFGTWWGVIGALVGPVILISNVTEYAKTSLSLRRRHRAPSEGV